MPNIEKIDSHGPDISLFVPSLKDDLADRVFGHANALPANAPWQPRWTAWFSLGVAAFLWSSIGLGIWLLAGR